MLVLGALALLLPLPSPDVAALLDGLRDDPFQRVECFRNDSDAGELVSNDDRAVGFAADAEHVLVRWRYYPGPDQSVTGFDVRRTDLASGSVMERRVTPIPDDGGEAFLDGRDPRWPMLFEQIRAELSPFAASLGVNLTDYASVHRFLARPEVPTDLWLDLYYPLAEALGRGWRDDAVVGGRTYRYDVTAQVTNGVAGANLPAVPEPMGTIVAEAGKPTPLTAPKWLIAVPTDPGAGVAGERGADWGAASLNRRLHNLVLLDIEAGDSSDACFPDAWIVGYDVFLETGQRQLLTADRPVSLMNAIDPGDATGDSPGESGYELVDFDFAWRAPGPGDYEFCTAGRDLLGNVAAQRACTGARVNDFAPPDAPHLVADPGDGYVDLSWTHDEPGDVDHYLVLRTRNTSSPAQPCAEETHCWRLLATVDADSTYSYRDSPVDPWIHYWYAVRAVDAAGNQGLEGGPNHTYLESRRAPTAPTLSTAAPGRFHASHSSTDVLAIEFHCTMGRVYSNAKLEYWIQKRGRDVDFSTEEVFHAAGTFTVTCAAKALDQHGQRSGFSLRRSTTLRVDATTQPLPAPILVSVKSEGGGARTRWQFPTTPQLDHFDVVRTDLTDGNQVRRHRAGASERSLTDTTARAQHTYRYAVEAIGIDGTRALSNGQVWMNLAGDARIATLVPWAGAAAEFPAGPNSDTPLYGIALKWDCTACPLDTQWALFRSVSPTDGYIQITPIGLPYYVSSNDVGEVTRTYHYKDPTGSAGRHWYVALGFSGRTGEVQYYTSPKTVPTDAAESRVGPSSGTSQLSNPTPSLTKGACRGVAPSQSLPLVYAGGFRVYVKWAAATVDAIYRISGPAELELRLPSGKVRVPTTISGIQVSDTKNTVCAGETLVTMPTPKSILKSPDAPYTLHSLRLRGTQWTPNAPTARIEVPLPAEVLYRRPSNVGRFLGDTSLMLSNVNVDSTLGFTFTRVASQVAGHTCDKPQFWFELDTLPLRLVPSGKVTIKDGRITLDTQCVQYVNRHDVPRDAGTGAAGARKIRDASGLWHGNDGYLRTAFANSKALAIDKNGLAGTLQQARAVEWATGVPYGFHAEAERGFTLTLARSRISYGTMDQLAFSIEYLRSREGASPAASAGRVEGAAAKGVLHPGGRYGGAVTYGVKDPVAWGGTAGFTLQGAQADLLLGFVTYPGAPEAWVWSSRNDAWADANDAHVGRPERLDSGLNLRATAADLTWECDGGPFPFTVGADLYLRRGGVTGVFAADLAPDARVDIYEYETTLSPFKLLFVDNHMHQAGVAGDVTLPGPAGFGVHFTDMTLGDDGCAETIDIVPTDVVARYWSVDIHADAALFADVNMASKDSPRYLWIGGSYTNLKHLLNADGSPVTGLGIRTAFEPNGQFKSSRLVQASMRYIFNGMPILLEEVRLSKAPAYIGDRPSEGGEGPAWLAAATVSPVPEFDPLDGGFIEVDGPLLVPGFGATTVPEGKSLEDRAKFQYAQGGDESVGEVGGSRAALSGPEPDGSSSGGDLLDYVGATAMQSINKLWVDNAETLLRAVFDQVVYFPDPDITSGFSMGHLVIFDKIEIGEKDKAPFSVDIAVIISPSTKDPALPGSVTGYLGLSAGVGALWAVAEIADDIDETGSFADAKKVLESKYAAKLFPDKKDAMLRDAGGEAGYYTLLEKSWDKLKAFPAPRLTHVTEAVEALEDADDYELPERVDIGGGTSQKLRDDGLTITRMRGTLLLTTSPNFDFDRFDIAAKVSITMDKGRKNIFTAEEVRVVVEDSGKVVVEGSKVKILDLNKDFDISFTIVVVPKEPRFEAAFELREWSIEDVVEIDLAGVYIGIGKDLYYFGAAFEGRFALGDTEVGAGGAVLFGRVQTDSDVLKAKFPDVITNLEKLKAAPTKGDAKYFDGFYLRATGEVPILATGILTVNVGARVGLWYWTSDVGDVYGGELGGYVRGTLLGVIHGRGDLTLTYNRAGASDSFSGTLWMAAGIGACDTGKWKTWDRVFGDNGWFCLAMGAKGTVKYEDDDWRFNFDPIRFG